MRPAIGIAATVLLVMVGCGDDAESGDEVTTLGADVVQGDPCDPAAPEELESLPDDFDCNPATSEIVGVGDPCGGLPGGSLAVAGHLECVGSNFGLASEAPAEGTESAPAPLPAPGDPCVPGQALAPGTKCK
jgi:hypothetical protein